MKRFDATIWQHASACFLLSALALLLGAGSVAVVLADAFSDYADGCGEGGSGCRAPSSWIMFPFAALGVVLFALAATLLVRGLYLVARRVHRFAAS